MNMKLNENNEHLVLDNIHLVDYLVQKKNLCTPYSSDYDDIVSIGKIGLIKAAITYDPSKKIAFSTYAAKCIYNEIFMHYRKSNRYAKDLSLDEPIKSDEPGIELTLKDTLEAPNSDFVDDLVKYETFVYLISIILNCLKGNKRLVMLYKLANLSQCTIGNIMHISQSYVSRIINKSTKEIREIANNQTEYTETFIPAIIGNSYKISFSSENKTLATILQNLASAKNSSGFRVSYNNKQIVILTPADPSSFYLIAKMFQEIDNFSMNFVSN